MLGLQANLEFQDFQKSLGDFLSNASVITSYSIHYTKLYEKKEVRQITDTLDAVGNTTAAIGKGFAIGSAALTALALFASYGIAVGLSAIDVMNPNVFIGLTIGAMLPYLV